ncbi:MAG: helicase-related protein [Candidatus Phytoplasma pruni]|nr:helicase-related protein [Candidatus Phytoplasma pruni]
MNSNLNQMFVKSNLYPKLVQNDINTLKELIFYKPKKYQNFLLSNINQAMDKEIINVIGKIVSEPISSKDDSDKKRLNFQILIHDDVFLDVVLFNKFYLANFLKINKNVFIKGKYNLYNKSITASLISFDLKNKNKIKPVYGIKNITDRSITTFLKNIFNKPQLKIKENLSPLFLKKYNLIDRKEALMNLHLPKSQQLLHKTLKRFKHEEALNIAQKLFEEKKKLPFKKPLNYGNYYIKTIMQKIPFSLTDNQKKIVKDIYSDLKQNYPTKRLIQGDVGSGKTITVFLAAIAVISAKKQVLMMAPTEILAKQHYLNFTKLFPEIKTIFITSKSKKKKTLQKAIYNNEYQMVIGTHLLANTEFHDLGLIIIDETHKFGTDVKDKTSFQNLQADVLYLTATPIPKTLAVMYFGLLKTSLLTEPPYAKKSIITERFPFEDIVPLLKENQAKNEQTYIVVPAIKQNAKKFNIETIKYFLEEEKIQHLYVLHGKKNNQEQEDIMAGFVKNPQGILLATTIIEVGIDIPNATTIVILGADRFGLSQLHQLRGRVGRNEKQNYCFLVPENPTDNQRLNILEQESNGFKLSEFDLKNRGPGDFVGKKQSGYLKYHFLNVATDFKIISQVQKDFENLENKKRLL